jgi:hypothetical protein
MIRVEPSPAAPARRPDRDDRDDASSIDFKSHLQAAKPRAEQPKPAPKKQPAQQDDDQPDAQPQAQAQATAPQPLTDLGAAITRALAALQATPTDAKAATTATDATAAIDATKTPAAPAAEPPLSPLEQAVHDIIAALPQPKPEVEHEDTTKDEPAESSTESPTPAPVVIAAPAQQTQAPAARAVPPPAPIAEPRATEMPAATSHMHLVLGDGDDRVVLTVAVRGQDVNVSMRSGDEGTAAALARNAASLDHAMRAHGLDLASFSSERDPDHPTRRDRPDRQPQRDDSEQFVLEEKS